MAGALRWVLHERLNASQPQGAATSESPHQTPTSDFQGAHAERSPRLLVLSPFVFRGSRRQWGVSPRTRVSGDLAVEDNQPSRQLALLEPETTAGNQPRVYKSPSSPRPLQGNRPPCLQKPLEPETTAGQPAPVSTQAPGTRDHCKQPAPCLQKFLVLSTEGNRPSSLEQDSLPETTAGNQPRVYKSSCNSKTGTHGDNQSHSEPALPV